MAAVDRHWDAITWDFNELLGFSPNEYFMFEPGPTKCGWQRKRRWSEFWMLFDRLANVDGTAVQESVLLDPEVIEEMAKAKESKTFVGARLWRHTREIELFQTMIEAKIGKKIFKRPRIPGHDLREKRKVIKLKDKLASVGVT